MQKRASRELVDVKLHQLKVCGPRFKWEIILIRLWLKKLILVVHVGSLKRDYIEQMYYFGFIA